MDKEVLNQKIEIDKAKDELKMLQKTVEAAQQEWVQLYDSTMNAALTGGDQNKLKNASLIKYNNVQTAMTTLDNRLQELVLLLNKLAINANGTSIITEMQRSLEQYKKNPVTSDHVDGMNRYIAEYMKLDEVCKKITEHLRKIPQQSDRFASYESLHTYISARDFQAFNNNYLNELWKELDFIGYPTDMLNLILKNPGSKYVAQQRLEIFRIKEYMTDKKISAFGNMLTELYMEVGKLLQDAHVEFSRDLNRIKALNSITWEDEQLIKHIAGQISDIFGLIQTVNAHVSVLRVFMQTDNSQSRELGKTINSLYKRLLNFLKITDYIKEGTTAQYTLAAHANGSNIDLIRYTVRQEDALTKNTQSYVYDIWIRGGLKIDFSVGIFATGLIDEAYEKKEHFNDQEVSIDSLFTLSKKNRGCYGFAFGGMVNISPRMGADWIAPGLSLGIAYGDNQNLQFLAGGSLLLGKSERILLHAGCAFGAAKVLDRSAITYKDETKGLIRGDIKNYPVPMTDKFQCKFIFGISYNLSKKNALQAVSGQGLTKFNSNMQAVQ